MQLRLAPIPNVQFISALRSSLKVQIGMPLPKWLLELGAIIIAMSAASLSSTRLTMLLSEPLQQVRLQRTYNPMFSNFLSFTTDEAATLFGQALDMGRKRGLHNVCCA